ncbi:hypothetical protein [Nostoc sp. CALU 1950]|uniref:hypothetical protein n=1 Tax=Nostoc sp. CALU 1950 TaxID=3104321 RepID=UPI003EBF4749
MKQLKILICAYACEPGKGSEPGVGWNVAREVSKYHQIWVLTSNCHRQGLETELARNPLPKLHVVYLDPLGWIIDQYSSDKTKTLVETAIYRVSKTHDFVQVALK